MSATQEQARKHYCGYWSNEELSRSLAFKMSRIKRILAEVNALQSEMQMLIDEQREREQKAKIKAQAEAQAS